MPDLLKLSTLGGLEVRLGSRPVSGLGGKAAALLVYLACTGRAHSREVLAELLWDERETAQARTNLRVVLNRLPQALADHLSVTRETVAFDRSVPFEFDLADFERDLHAAWEPGRAPGPLPPGAVTHLEAAVSLYGGPFLAGFSLPGASGFESWMAAEQERLRRQVTTALHTLVTASLERGEHEAGVRQATRLLDLDPLDEEAHRHLMRLLAARGQRGAALRHYELCRQRLGEELGVEPDPQTRALAEHIRAGGWPAGPSAAALPSVPAPAPPLPQPTTPFIGRGADLTELRARLLDPACRLLTVVGLGGSGKTRLALEAVRHLEPSERGGVFFVPLVAVPDAAAMVRAVAQAVGLTPGSGDQARADLLGWLRDRELLLLLDGFEHLGGAAPLLAELLHAAPGLRLLVTSREALHLQAEWLFDLGGMDLPRTDAAADIEHSTAVRLFVQSARRTQARFTLDAANTAGVVRICRLVDGSPLALELAAAWVRTQDCATIAREIGRDLDFLTSPLRDVPERHRSMRVVFEHSWALLPEAEREGLRRLSVFRGGFEAEAAREVAGVEGRVLAALVDRSLLGWTGSARYELHELLRQFAGEKLAVLPGEQETIRARHAAYYQRVIAALPPESGLVSPEAWEEQRNGVHDLDNVMVAVELGAAEQTVHPATETRDYPVHIEASVFIRRPPTEVFAFIGHLENDPQWQRYTNIVANRYVDVGENPVGVGTHFEQTLRVLGRHFHCGAVITEYVPGARVAFRSTWGPVSFDVRRVIEAAPGGARLTCTSRFDTSALFRVVRTAVTRVSQRGLELNLESLKNLLEAGGARHPDDAGRLGAQG